MSKSESRVQSEIRLAAARRGWYLWRNNVGALLDARGVPVRYGLANDTAAMNKQLKSADLIGWQTVTITPDMVGQTFARVVSVEVKAEGLADKRDSRRAAQERWRKLVEDAGGIAVIIDDAKSLDKL